MSNENEMCFNIGNVKIPYTITDSNKTKSIRLVIDINGLRVVKPIRTKMEEVEKVINAKKNWIYKHYIQFQTMKVDEYKREWKSGEQVVYLGESYNIKIIRHGEDNQCIKFDGKTFEVYISDKLDDKNLKLVIEDSFRRWYRRTALESIRERLEYFCKLIGLSYKNLKIKEQKTRWGSCSKQGNLNFNWKLIMAPPWVLDYVVVHEICHLRYMNHSKDYWNMVERYMTNYKNAQEWLKKNGLGLM